MKILLENLLNTLLCSVFAGSLGVFFMHVYENYHPREVEIVYVDRPAPMPTRDLSDIRVVKLAVKKKVVRK